MAPFYDLLCTAHYPHLDTAFAMRIGDQNAFERLGILAWKQFSQRAGLGFPLVRRRILDLGERTPEACRKTRARLAGRGLDDVTLEALETRIMERARGTMRRINLAGEA